MLAQIGDVVAHVDAGEQVTAGRFDFKNHHVHPAGDGAVDLAHHAAQHLARPDFNEGLDSALEQHAPKHTFFLGKPYDVKQLDDEKGRRMAGRELLDTLADIDTRYLSAEWGITEPRDDADGHQGRVLSVWPIPVPYRAAVWRPPCKRTTARFREPLKGERGDGGRGDCRERLR